MNKLEKAIKGLETCLSTDDGDYKCERCPYKNTDLICIKEIKRDALELLKEQKDAIIKIMELEIEEAQKVKDSDKNRNTEEYHRHNAKYEAYDRVLAILQGEDGDGE